MTWSARKKKDNSTPHHTNTGQYSEREETNTKMPMSAGKKIDYISVQKKIPEVDMAAVAQLLKILKESDRNNDGCYNKDELKHALKKLGALIPSWRAHRCLSKADTDGDGEISGEEIDTLLEYLISRGF